MKLNSPEGKLYAYLANQLYKESAKIKTYHQLQKAKYKNQVAGNMIKLHAIELQRERIAERQQRIIVAAKLKLNLP